MMPVLCVLDANVIIADRRLGSASARTITSMAEAGLIRLAIPEVAFKEVVQNSLEVLDKARRDLKAVRRSIGPLEELSSRTGYWASCASTAFRFCRFQR